MMIMTCFCEMGDQQKCFKPSFQQEMLDVTKNVHHGKPLTPCKQELNLCKVPILPSLYEINPVRTTAPP